MILWKTFILCLYDFLRENVNQEIRTYEKRKAIILLLFLLVQLNVLSQDEFPKEPSIAIFTGLINYQGDLNPNSFSLGRSKFSAGAGIRKPLSRWFTVRAGFTMANSKPQTAITVIISNPVTSVFSPASRKRMQDLSFILWI